MGPLDSNPPRRSFKQRVLVDRQRLVKNVTFDRATILQLDPDGMDGALDAAADCEVLRNDAAFDLCAIADQKIRGAQLAFDPAKHLHWTIAFDFADDRHAGADARVRTRFVVRSGFGAICSTTQRCACSMTRPHLRPRCYPARVPCS